MKERFESQETIEIGKIHPDFKIVTGNETWAFNRFKNDSDGTYSQKLRGGFDAVDALDGIHLSAKIGLNRDDSIPHKFVIFAYASEGHSNELRDLASALPYSEIISDLDKHSRSTESSQREIVNPASE